MAISISHLCDFPGATGEAATVFFAGRAGAADLSGEFCDDHWPEVERGLLALGIRVESVRVDGKKRATYTAASGRTFSAIEARRWAEQQGLLAAGGAGRLPASIRDAYAAAH